ncbi:MAG: hypothetical protein KC619_22455 [Myxococcales bacterium]|nr:hypothetical protein [Myxococcales bacterium]
MADDDDLSNDPEAKALRPKTSKRVLVSAVIAGAIFGLGLAIASLVFEQYIPRVGLRALPDAGPMELPVTVDLDAGPTDEAAPWLGP